MHNTYFFLFLIKFNMKKILLILLIFTLFYFINIKADVSLNYKININYPVTEYKKLNKKINKKIDYYQNLFFKEIKDSDIIIYDYYTLFINYESYTYKNILSYVFFIEYFVGGAHPNHFIFTINYDTENNDFITSINNIKEISDYCRKELIKDKRIVNTSMLYDGTKPNKENFKNFVFTNNGYIFYFERYQVAPYSSGDISLIVPYNLKF